MTHEALVETLTRADAYAPDLELPASVRSTSVALEEIRRRIDMDVQELTKPVEPEKNQRSGWLVAAVAFAVVIVFIGAAMLLARPAAELPPVTTPPTTQAAPPTTEAVVEEATVTTVASVVEAEPVMTDEVRALLDSYEEAFNTGDEAAFRSFFADGFWRADPTDLSYTQSIEYMVNMMTNYGIREATLSIEDCVAVSAGVNCRFLYSGAVEEAIFFGPVIETVLTSIQDGRITDMLVTEYADGGLEEVSAQKIKDWVAANHPEDGPKMNLGDIMAEGVDLGQQGRDPVEALGLWLKYAPLWQDAGRP